MKSLRARVVICGYYGFGNAGDELILAAMLHELRALRPGLAVTVISGNPASTRASHEVDAVHWQDVPAIAAQVRAADLVVVGGGGLFQEYSGIDPDSLFTDRHYAITFYAEPAILGALCGDPSCSTRSASDLFLRSTGGGRCVPRATRPGSSRSGTRNRRASSPPSASIRRDCA